MVTGIWQLARVAMRTDARSLSGHLTRVGLGALLLWIVAISQWESSFTSAPGLSLFRSQLVMTHLFLSVNAVFGFSLIIQEEREAGTLELLRLAGMNSLSILLGKLIPRLVDSALLLAILVPYTLLEVTLGGLVLQQVVAAYVALFAYMWLVSMLGLWCSVRCQTAWSAVSCTGVLVCVYNLPYLVQVLGSGFSLVVSGWSELLLPQQLWIISQTDFQDSPWSSAVTLSFVSGLIIGLVAWLQFELSMSAAPQVATSSVRRRRRQSRVWGRPLVWKEFLFLMHGWTGFTVRTLLFIALFVWMLYDHDSLGRAFVWTGLLGAGVGLIDGSWTASRLFSEEKREQTWSTLVLTPHAIAQLSHEKWSGWLLGHAPSLAIPYLCIFLCPFFHENVDDLAMILELYIGSIGTGLAILGTLHLLAINSLSWGWKALPLTLTICCLGAYGFLSMFPWRQSIVLRNVFHAVTAGFLLMVILALRARLRKLLKDLSGEDA